ncbi:MAG: bifunctional phosphopantothenoylcysteine decarboxylase/phosphopantothenate--cysteine ligase CoaBC [Bacteroidota bacterium]
MWSGKTIVLGVTGGIAVYKAAELASAMRQRGASVEVIMTPAACEFVSPLTFRELTGNQVGLDPFAPPPRMEVQHIAYADRADVVAIVPATANTIAKIAHGLADNLLTAVVLATRKPILVAPAMNTGMYENQATQANLALLRARGVRIVGPATGRLLCGTSGAGRLSPLDEIMTGIEALLCPQDLAGEHVIVTAGGTREPIDPVRFIGNRSSGRMGTALARVMALRGATVVLVAGAMEVPAPIGVELVRVETTGEMRAAVMARLPEATAIVMAGAPADFRARAPRAGKIKRERETDLSLALAPTEDIAAEIGRVKRPDQILVAFAAETEDLLQNARRKLARKGADLIVANDITAPGCGFGAETNQVHLLNGQACRSLPLMAKEDVAWAIADALLSLRLGRGLDG